MVDYAWDIGDGAKMMIRDYGLPNGNVEFWFHARPSAFNSRQDWGYDAGSGYVGGIFRLNAGGAWHRLGTVHIPTSRFVMMRMIGEDLGWPTSERSVWINRATVPAPPTMYSATALSTSAVRVRFGGNGDGGTPVREWQIGYGLDAWNPQYFVGSGGQSDIGGLNSGRWWYFWARARNDMGWSGWSNKAQAFTWRIPDPPNPVTFDLVTQRSLRARFTGGFNGGEPVDEWQLGYGLNPNTPQIVVASNGTNQLNNLQAGAIYYFWARGRNAVGWSGWSSVRAQTLRAGALVKVGPVWKRAVPYVKDNGVWRLARPYVKIGGVWRETS